jgi:hypothetical protein
MEIEERVLVRTPKRNTPPLRCGRKTSFGNDATLPKLKTIMVSSHSFYRWWNNELQIRCSGFGAVALFPDMYIAGPFLIMMSLILREMSAVMAIEYKTLVC